VTLAHIDRPTQRAQSAVCGAEQEPRAPEPERRPLALANDDIEAPAASGVRVEITPIDGLRAEGELRIDTITEPATDLGGTWENLMSGRFRLHSSVHSAQRIGVVLTTGGLALGGTPISPIEAILLTRVLAGFQQKAIAVDEGIACSTASKWHTSALTRMGLRGSPIPLLFIIAAQAWVSGKPSGADTRIARFEYGGIACVLLGVPRPVIGPEGPLTPSEKEIARLVIEGCTRQTIADYRETSAQTVACQLRSIYLKLGLSGRNSLVARAVELGWLS
jgi:DNA-binding CsgD family transcriptional regulator